MKKVLIVVLIIIAIVIFVAYKMRMSRCSGLLGIFDKGCDENKSAPRK